jgi:hypothetical protein
MSLADLGSVAEFVFAVRADPHIVHSCGCEHSNVLVGHESVTISTLWHATFPPVSSVRASHKPVGHGYQSRARRLTVPNDGKRARIKEESYRSLGVCTRGQR